MNSLKKPYGIGMVGLGNISRYHLAGYKQQNLPVVAGYGASSSSRVRFQAEEPEVRVYDDLNDLVNDPAVEILDIASRHEIEARREIIQKAAAAGKPVLIQKPLALDY